MNVDIGKYIKIKAFQYMKSFRDSTISRIQALVNLFFLSQITYILQKKPRNLPAGKKPAFLKPNQDIHSRRLPALNYP